MYRITIYSLGDFRPPEGLQSPPVQVIIVHTTGIEESLNGGIDLKQKLKELQSRG